MGQPKYRLCPHCKKDIRAGVKDIFFNKHRMGCMGSNGISKGVRRFKKLPVMR